MKRNHILRLMADFLKGWGTVGEKLLRYYSYVNEKRGLAGKIELAKQTKIPSPKASLEPDSPELIALFKKKVEKITGEPAPDF